MKKFLFLILVVLLSCNYHNKKNNITLYGDSTIVGSESEVLSRFISDATASKVERRGMSGQSFGGKLSSDSLIYDLENSSPDIVVLHSVNDPRSSNSVNDMIEGIDKICKNLKSKNRDVKIFICSPYKYGGVSGTAWQNVRSDRQNNLGLLTENYAKAIEKYCFLKNYSFINLYNKCNFDSEIETCKKVYTVDGVHLSRKGNKIISSIISDAVNNS